MRTLALAVAVVTLAPASGGSAAPGGEHDVPLWTSPKRKVGGASLADLAERARPAVVHVRGVVEEGAPGERSESESGKTSIGTGFIINKDGFVVTNEHVVRG